MMTLNRYDLAFCVRRLPRDVRDLMKKHGARVFLAGGFIRAVVAGETVNDIDLFTSSPDDARALAMELAATMPVVRKPYESENAFTVHTRRISVQFIHRWSFSAPEEAVESFDFTIAKSAMWWGWDPGGACAGWRSVCDDNFYSDLAAKRLVYTSPQRNEDAGGSMLRVLKFYQRGYRIPLESMGAVIARLCQGLSGGPALSGWMKLHAENDLAKQFTGLLREVDPLVDPDAEGHEDSIELPEAA